MKSSYQFKPFVCIILLFSIILNPLTLKVANAADIPIDNVQHKQTIEQFLTDIRIIQRQVFDIAQLTLRDQIPGDRQLQTRINLINYDIERLNKVIQDYLALVPGVSDQNRHVLLTFNVLNLVKSGLYTLSQLVSNRTDGERLELLDEYFRTRVTALDTLAILEEILDNFNP